MTAEEMAIHYYGKMLEAQRHFEEALRICREAREEIEATPVEAFQDPRVCEFRRLIKQTEGLESIAARLEEDR